MRTIKLIQLEKYIQVCFMEDEKCVAKQLLLEFSSIHSLNTTTIIWIEKGFIQI